MNNVYIAIEKDVEGFEFYRRMWVKRGINGIMACSMTEGIEKAIVIEESGIEQLCFISIVADSINYMPQLMILREVTDTPILIATSKSNYNEDEHHKAIENGADFYGRYCDEPENNIRAVLTIMNSIAKRGKKQFASGLLFGCGILLSQSHSVAFVRDFEVPLTKKEFDILYLLMINKGKVVTHAKILQEIWGNEIIKFPDLVWRTVNRLRKKLSSAINNEHNFIKTQHREGYIFS